MVSIVERTVVPLADQTCRVASLFKHIAHRYFSQSDPIHPPHFLGRRASSSMGIPSSQKRRPRGRADRRSGIMLREAQAPRRKLVQVRRAYTPLTEQAEIAVTHVGGDYQDDVGFRQHPLTR